jgi:Tfp pilus assembly major pilin PilA
LVGVLAVAAKIAKPLVAVVLAATRVTAVLVENLMALTRSQQRALVELEVEAVELSALVEVAVE